MELLLFILGVFTLSVAWRARSEARQARKMVMSLQLELAELRRGATAPAAQQPAEPATGLDAGLAKPPPAVAPQPAASRAPSRVTPPPTTAPLSAISEISAFPPEPSAPTPQSTATPPAPRPPRPTPQWLLAVRRWLFGGNLVAKLGLLILFIGVSFLLKYTAARVSVPIEFRLAGIVLADIALLAWGWRIRLSRPAISLPVQGAALAVLMLVTFGAFRLYHLIPGGLAFALLFVLTVFTCLLAVLQNAMWLAIFGIAGGFAAPILASSGGGSHIGLFSYYALLNAGVFALALLRSWRPLNLLGFAFTFAIGTTWGVLRYSPDNYLSVQLFLLLFFVFYVGIPLAYARQQAVKLKNYVDGTLIFGTPMLGFGLQYSLMRGVEFGMAYSALVLGLFYIGLATLLRRRREKYALLSDAFLALGVVFGTLAIPFALDGRWTSAAWALEGAGIVWIGLRQKQKLAWMFGLLVQAGAWLSFIGTISGLSPVAALESNLWLGFVLLAITAFLMATRFRRQDSDSTGFTALAAVFLAGATVWLLAGAWTEIFLRTDGVLRADLLVASALLTATGLYFIAKRMAWSLAGGLALAAQAIAGVMMLEHAARTWLSGFGASNLFERPFLGALMIFAGAIVSAWALMRQNSQNGDSLKGVYRLTLAWSMLWWFSQVLPDLSGWLASWYDGFGSHYTFSTGFARFCYAYLLLLAITILPALLAARRLRWPALRWFTLPVWLGLAVSSGQLLMVLYLEPLPSAEAWTSYVTLWLAGEWLLRAWPANDWTIRPTALRALHLVRSTGPWLMVWPLAAYHIDKWLSGTDAEARLLADAGWTTDASWARFLPAWLMMAAVAWLMRRTRAGGWPVAPIAEWYRRRLIPLACGWAALLVTAWNLTQDGAMAPLPYIPLLNPLDLSTCFAMLMVYGCQRHLREHQPPGGMRSYLLQAWPAHWVAPLPLTGALLGYLWFNLALLRTVSHYIDIPYEAEAMFASQFVQALLSLVWSVTALVMMRYAARRTLRAVWIGGAVLLALVVAKLFLIDLSNVGGVERIVSFVGVGALMVGIGYLAPYPTTEATPEPP